MDRYDVSKMIIIIFIAVFLLADCSKNQAKDASRYIDNGEYIKARDILQKNLETEPGDIESSLLMLKSYRKEFFATYDRHKYQSPLEGEWSLFPGRKMENIDKYREILSAVLKRGIHREELEEECYFLLIYDYFRLKYKGEKYEEEDMQKNISILVDWEGLLADESEFWSIYASNGYSINFNWQKIDPFFKRYPESELAGLKILEQIFRKTKISIELKKDDFVINRIRDYYVKYPNFSLYADSLFIYREIDDKLDHYRNEGSINRNKKAIEQYLESLLSEKLSATINRYILWQQGLIKLETGNTVEGFLALGKVIAQEQDKFQRDKLNLEIGERAFALKNYGVAISSLRQIDGLGIEGKKKLWLSYLEVDNEVEAGELYKEMQSELTAGELAKLKSRKYNFDLKKLQLSELNLVWGSESVTIEGKISNPTQKLYEGITINLTLSGEPIQDNKVTRIRVEQLYPGKEEKFTVFINYQKTAAKIKVKGEVSGFEKASG